MAVLRDLLSGIDCYIIGDENICIADIKHVASEIVHGDVYVALRGAKADGHDYIDIALQNGASAIVSEMAVESPLCRANVVCCSTRKALAVMAANACGNPQHELSIIGVVGTNGKTTTAKLLYDVMIDNGQCVGLLSTSGNIIGNKTIASSMTTPDPVELYRLLRMIVSSGGKSVVMELSAHAIALDKLYGLTIDVGIFTNLSQDHLDYFGDMATYGNVKKSIFTSQQIKLAVVNIDDDLGKQIVQSRSGKTITYSIKNSFADMVATDIIYANGDTTYKLFGATQVNFHDNDASNILCAKLVKTRLIGEFNVYNQLGVITALISDCCNINIDNVIKSISNAAQVAGRFNTKYHNNRLYIIDYAHTPDGLDNVLRTSKKFAASKSKLILVFGCGGDRDSTKRAQMGAIAAKYADIIVLTSDNPRSEDRVSIINDILKGIKKSTVFICPDRYYAINQAHILSNDGDVLLIAGKGAEDYIEECGTFVHYSDVETVSEVIGEKWSLNY